MEYFPKHSDTRFFIYFWKFSAKVVKFSEKFGEFPDKSGVFSEKFGEVSR